MIRSLIWDFDGTLFDTYPAIARAYTIALHQFGKTVATERVIELTSISLNLCTQTLVAEHNLPADQFDAAFTRAYAAITLADQPPFPYIVDICRSMIDNGGRNFIITHRRQASLLRLLEGYQMLDLFTDRIAGDDGYPKKPDAQAFYALIERNQIDPDTALAIGDRETDIGAAQAAGLQTCLFGSLTTATRATYTIATFDQLYQIITPN